MSYNKLKPTPQEKKYFNSEWIYRIIIKHKHLSTASTAIYLIDTKQWINNRKVPPNTHLQIPNDLHFEAKDPITGQRSVWVKSEFNKTIKF